MSDATERPRISVVVPAINEAQCLIGALSSADRGRLVERILVDARSDDNTAEEARAANVRIVQSPRGRATQMNVGARAASGDVLLFLHADTRLPSDFIEEVERILALRGVVAGAFRLRIDAPGTPLRVIETVANWRARRLQFPYGDQALFLRADRFRALGGYPELPIMEDFELVRRLRRAGRIAISSSSVRTSARRWQELGPLRATVANQLAILSYLVGRDPTRIADGYRGRRPMGHGGPARVSR